MCAGVLMLKALNGRGFEDDNLTPLFDLLLLTAIVGLPHACHRTQFATVGECNDAICACWSGQASALPACKRILADSDYKEDASCANKVGSVRVPFYTLNSFKFMYTSEAYIL